MPAFALAFMLTNEENALILEQLGWIVNFCTITASVAKITIAATTSERLLATAGLLKNTMYTVISNDDIENWKKQGGAWKTFADSWEKFKAIDAVVAGVEGATQLMLNKEVLNSMINGWSSIAYSLEENDKVDKRTIQQINEQMNDLKNIITHENIVY